MGIGICFLHLGKDPKCHLTGGGYLTSSNIGGLRPLVMASLLRISAGLAPPGIPSIVVIIEVFKF